jgi:hypothetical protein
VQTGSNFIPGSTGPEMVVVVGNPLLRNFLVRVEKGGEEQIRHAQIFTPEMALDGHRF